MPVSPDELKNVMATVAATVTIVTVASDGGPIGLTVSAFLSVSADPAIILVCIDKATASLEAVLDADGFTVNIMPEGAEDEAMLFATHGAEKFGVSEWTEPETRNAGPVLASSLARLECVTIDKTEVGDHWVLYGSVMLTDIAMPDVAPLVWRGGGFVQLS